MQLVGALLVVAAAWLTGRALLPARDKLERSAWEEQCLAYLLGAAALPLAAMLVTWAGVQLDAMIAWLLLLAGGAAGVLRVRADRRSGLPCAPMPVQGWGVWLIGVLGVGSVLAAVAFPLNEFDPILHWATKGKLLYYTGDPLDEAFTALTGNGFGRVHTHPNYPLGVPFLEAFAAHAGFGWSDRWVQLPLAFWSACIPGVVALALRPAGRRAAGLGALIAAATPILYSRGFLLRGLLDVQLAGLTGYTLLGGGADLPLAAMTVAAVGLLLQAARTGSAHVAALAGLALAGAIFMKNEGLALAGVLALAFLIVQLADLASPALADRKRAWLALGLCLLVTAGAAAPWLLHRERLPKVDENYAEQFQPEKLSKSLAFFWSNKEPLPPNLNEDLIDREPEYRLPQIARFFGLEFVNFLSWGALWILFWLCLPVGRAFRSAEARLLALFVLGGLLLYALILFVTPWYLYQLRFTGIPERLMLHLLGPAAILVGLRLADGGPEENAPARTISE